MSKPFTPKLTQIAVAEDTIVGLDSDGTVWVHGYQNRRPVDGKYIKAGSFWVPLIATVTKGETEVES